MSPRRRLRDYYRQFEELSPQEASERLRARREQEKSLELARVGELDCAGPEWHEPPDPEVVNAATFALRRAVNRYPDPATWRAREAVAAHHGVPVERVALGHGAGELLQAALRELAAGGEVIVPWPGWAPLPALAARAGVTPVPVALGADGTPDLDAVAAAVGPATRAVALSSPNDPTGRLVRRDALAALAVRLPGHVTLLVDEALVEIAGTDEAVSAAALLDAHPNLLVLRSFSKGWAMAGLRAGHVLGPPGAEELLERLSPGQGVAAPTQAAVAAALGDPHRAGTVLSRRRRAAAAERERLAALLDDTPVVLTPSDVHLVWLRAEGLTAAALAHGLAAQQVRVAAGAAWGDDAHVRVSLRDRTATERLAAALRRVAGR